MKYAALVIGVNDYENNIKLTNAVNDAKAITDCFRELKYDVFELINPQFTDYVNTEADLMSRNFEKQYDALILYFSGHGFMTNASDCLAMKDALQLHKNEGLQAKQLSIDVQDFIKKFKKRGIPVVVAILDACRDDLSDYADEDTHRGVSSRMIASFGSASSAPFQSFIAYSTTACKSASDGGKGVGHSRYTNALLAELLVVEPIEQVFKNVRREVHKNDDDQLPWEYSCLTENFYLNYGQLGKYYEAQYREDAFKYVKYDADSTLGIEVISLLRRAKENTREEAIRMISSAWQEMSKDDLFVAGRMICHHAANGSEICMSFLSDVSRQRLFNTRQNNHLLNGYFYELYFDEKDEVRSEILGDADFTSAMEQLHMFIKNSKVEKFIKEMLGRYEHFFYVVGSTSEIPVCIEAEDLDCIDEDGCPYKVISSIHVFDDDVTDNLDWEDEMLNERTLRNCIIESLALPRQLVRIKMVKGDATFIRYKLTNIAYDLQECMAADCPDEVCILSSLSYVEDVDDICIRKITSIGSGIFIEGSCFVDVHMEFDNEDMGNMTFPCTFETEMQEDETGYYRISTDTCKYRVDTSEYYK